MTRNILTSVLLLLFASLVTGWLRAGTSAGQQPPIVDGWDEHLYHPPTHADYEKMSEKVKESSLLPLSRIEARKQAAPQINTNPTSGAQNITPFPKILGNTVQNGTKYVILTESQKQTIRVKVGDILKSGWEITSISDTSVVAVKNKEEFKAPLISYLQSAFVKPEESVMDGSKDLSGARKPSTKRNGGGGE